MGTILPGFGRGRMKLGSMIKVTRVPFVTAVVVPVLLGAAIAWGEGAIHGGYLLLTIVGAVCINLGLNMSNDYFDHRSGADRIKRELTPFSGGSRTIQDGILTAKQVLLWSILFYLVGIVIGLYLTTTRGPIVLGLGLAGMFLAFFHNAPPFKLYHLAPGLGELAVGIGFGPVVVLGSYYVQAQQLSYEALWASIPVGLLIAAVLSVNELPDSEADKAVGRKTFAAVLGRERGAWVYVALLLGAYVSLVAGIALRVLPYPTLLALLTVPLAYRSARTAVRFHSDTPKLVPAMAGTVQFHMLTGLALCVGFAIGKFR